MIPLSMLHAEALRASEEEFLALHPHPALVVNPDPDEELDRPASAVMFNTMKIATRDNVEEWISQTHEDMDFSSLLSDPNDMGHTIGAEQDTAKLREQVVFATKQDGNPFMHMITFGRVPNNDIVFSLPSVSKVHGYLHQDTEGTWWLYDQRSTNGTWVDGIRVPPGERAPLRDGAWINVGPSLGLKFFMPGTFYAFLRGLGGKLPGKT